MKRQWDKYNDRVIFWVSGESEEAFEQSVIGLLKDSQGTVSAGHDSSVVALQQRDTLVREFFSELSNNSPPGTLLVVDGLSGSASLQARLQKHLDGLAINCVILTTTSREVASYYPRQLQIQGLDEDDAVALLTSGISDEFRGPEAGRFFQEVENPRIRRLTLLDARELARLLKYHPLSLKVAASLISRHPQSISQYVEKWTNRALHDEGLSTQDALLHAFELSFEELQRRNPVSAYILMLFSFLDHRDMWYELCFNATDKSSPIWLQQISSQKRPRDFISPMHNLSFIEAKPHKSLGCVYEIHPAIHEFARWKAAQNETEYLTSAISLVAAQVPRSTHEDFVAITQRLEPHVSQCMLYIQQDRAGTQLDLVELEKFGNLFRHVGRYDEALQLYRVILGYLRTDEPSDFNNNMMANIENNIGLVHHARHEYSEAFDAYERASYMRQESLVEDRDALAITLYNQGRSLLVLNRLEEAQVKLQAAAGHFSNALHDEQRERHEREDVIRSYQRILNDLGETHLRTGQLEEAEQYIKMAFRGYLEAGHAMHPAAFAVRLNMGRVCVERYFFASARSIFEYIIATYSKWWGRRHPETMRAVNELAGSYFRHGKMKQDMGDGGDEELEYAAQCWTETLHFHEEMFGKEADVVNLTRSKLHELKELKSLITTNPYEMYYTSGQ